LCEEALLDVFRTSLNLGKPWRLTGLQLDEERQQWNLYIDFERGAKVRCPLCKQTNVAYEACARSRKYLNLLHWSTWIHASLPVFYCPNCQLDRVLMLPLWSGERFHAE